MSSQTDSSGSPLQQLQDSPSIKEQQIYSHARNSTEYEVVHEDEQVVLLADRETGTRRMEKRQQFEAGIDSAWTLEGTAHSNSDDKEDGKSDIEEIGRGLVGVIELEENGVREELIEEILSAIVNYGTERVNLEEISGVGEAKAERLEEKGLDTKIGIELVSDDQMTEIDGIGESLADKIHEEALNNDE